MKWHDHYSLREISPLKTGGAADYFCICRQLDEIIDAVNYAREEKISPRVLGTASMVLMSDSGYPGLIIQNKTSGILFMHDRSQVIADSGINLSQLVSQVISQGYSGIEFLYDAPGTLGGSLYNNHSVFGYFVGEYVRSVTVLMPLTGEIRSIPVSNLDLRPSRSVFKSQRQNGDEQAPIILTVTLQLSKMTPASCLQRIQYFKSLRAGYPYPPLPHLQVFDTTLTSQLTSTRAVSRRALLPELAIAKNQIREFRSGDIAVDAQNPNYLVNTKVGSSRDAQHVIEMLQRYCLERYKTAPQVHVEYLGVWQERDSGNSGGFDNDGVDETIEL